MISMNSGPFMRSATLLLVVMLAACAPWHTEPDGMPPIAAHGPPEGMWLVTLTSSDLGEVRIPMHFKADARGAFEAYSRPGALARTIGTGRALMARLFGWRTFARGALLHLAQGESEVLGDSVRLRGIFLSPVIGRGVFTGMLVHDELRGELRRAGDGALWALMHASRADEILAVRDYTAVTHEVRKVLAERIYNPSVLESRRWNEFFSRLERRLPAARDDAEALAIFNLAARSLEVSHLALVGDRFGEVVPSLARIEEGAERPAVRIDYPHPLVAHLVIQHFSGTPEPINRAFDEIVSAGVEVLIVDLRGNSGGNLSSMTVAAHVLSDPTPAGVFLGPVWWRDNRALPDLESTDEFPVLDAYDLDLFFGLLRSHGVLVGRVEPSKPHFGGRIYVLIDRRTASAAEPLAELLKRTGRATLIGERTAGAMLSSERIPLQAGLVLIAPTADYYTAEGHRLEGTGVAPHVEVNSAVALAEALRHAVEPE